MSDDALKIEIERLEAEEREHFRLYKLAQAAGDDETAAREAGEAEMKGSEAMRLYGRLTRR